MLPSSSLSALIQVFQTSPSQKLPTHDALKKDLPSLNVSKCNELVKKLITAFERNSVCDLVVMNEFADLMHEAGLETKRAHEIRNMFLSVSGVVAVKGCGAGLHDTFLVAGESLDQKSLTQVAADFKLTGLGSLQELLW